MSEGPGEGLEAKSSGVQVGSLGLPGAGRGSGLCLWFLVRGSRGIVPLCLIDPLWGA